MSDIVICESWKTVSTIGRPGQNLDRHLNGSTTTDSLQPSCYTQPGEGFSSSAESGANQEGDYRGV